MKDYISRKFHKLRYHPVIKTTGLNGIAHFGKAIAGLIANKVLAVFIGPAGIYFAGQLTNFLYIASFFSTGGIIGGITKYTAEHNESPEIQKDYLSTAFSIVGLFTLVTSVIVTAFSSPLSNYLFGSYNYTFLLALTGITLFFFAGNLAFVAVLNGYKQFPRIVQINVFTSLSSIVLIALGTYFFKQEGFLISTVAVQVLTFLFTLHREPKLLPLLKTSLTHLFQNKKTLHLLQFGLMSATSTFATPFVQMQIRLYANHTLGTTEAALWQGMIKISEAYLGFIFPVFGYYYLPRLSELKDNYYLKREILGGYKIFAPLVLVGLIAIYFLREPIILLLFSPKFLDMQLLFPYQLIGDFFKLIGWFMTYFLVAKAMTKHFIGMELGLGIVSYVLTLLFVKWYGFTGITMAYMISFILYFIVLAFLLRHIFLAKKPESTQ